MWCGEITPEVQEHLQSCARCRSEQASLAELGIAVEGVAIPRPTRSLLPSPAEIEAVITSHKRRRYTKWLSAGAVAACVVLAATQVPALFGSGKSQSDVVTQPNQKQPPQTVTQLKEPVQQIQDLLGQYHYSLSSTGPTIVTTDLPASFQPVPGTPPFGLYYDYANVLSKQIGYDLTPYLGQSVTVYILPLKETFAGGRIEGYQDSEVIGVFSGKRLVGAWMRSLGGSAMASLDNKLFGEITKQTWGEWTKAEKLESYTSDRVKWTPDQVITKYLQANDRQDRATMSSLLSLSYQFYLQTNGVDRGTPTPIVTDNYYGPQIQTGVKYTVKFREDNTPGQVDVTAGYLVKNRRYAAMKTYEVDGGPNAMFFTVVQENQDGPWQIDNVSSGP
nr:DUF4830 domain-containing protein [Tumebacillus amylolyticus]